MALNFFLFKSIVSNCITFNLTSEYRLSRNYKIKWYIFEKKYTLFLLPFSLRKLKLYFINLPINQKNDYKPVIKTGRPVAKETTELVV